MPEETRIDPARLAGSMRVTPLELEDREQEQPAPIGWGGKRLVDMLAESERLFTETGRYCGLERLHLKESDPMRFEQAFAKLRGALVSSRETALHVTASPIVRNIGELCFSLYTPEGDSIALSTGIIVHVHTMSEAIKYMIRNLYEEEPGIHDGDIFCNNDPAIGDVHTSDVATFVPIFYDGELIGWAGGVTHQVDIGASMPGHSPAQTQNRFEDGYLIPCEKIGENDRVYKVHRLRSQMAVRTPMFWDLDEKARVAGCHMIRSAVERIIAEEGIDYYKHFVREVVEEGRQVFRLRVRERLIPGVYHAATCIDLTYPEVAAGRTERPRKDYVFNAPIELTIGADGSFEFSLEGASKWGEHPANSSIASMQGGLWVLLSQSIFYDGRVNDGAYFATRTHFPPGSWCNPQAPYVAYGAAWATLIPSFTGLFRCLSRGFYGRGYREEVIAGYGYTGDAAQGGGLLKNGVYFPIATFDMSSVGLGAGAIKDGLDYGYAMWNPEADMGDIEVWESLELGLPWLGRRVKPDTAGFGKRRGASGWESLRVSLGTQGTYAFFSRLDGLMFHGTGLMGGYPNATGYRFWLWQSNLKDVIAAKQPYPVGEGDPAHSEVEALLKGKVERTEHGVTLGRILNDWDVVQCNMSGAPGFGDPVERDPASLVKDVAAGFYTPELVRRVYGAVLQPAGRGASWSLDEEATRERRAELRSRRKERAVPYKEFWKRERERLLAGNMIEPVKRMYSESMELSPHWAAEFRSFWELPQDYLP